ncbi:hypothetical protein J2S74_002958 [Evansella vedderi]|uniref:Uncharacterized protein n=1 Tax=Evansella vedderi TaxID=38282 RepID=A0ABT9ZWH3_9BACI|nr:hypothetical protein [Evansella vedderi]MDQ0255576.1 hypothetical protein [Evansella vedderi]
MKRVVSGTLVLMLFLTVFFNGNDVLGSSDHDYVEPDSNKESNCN